MSEATNIPKTGEDLPSLLARLNLINLTQGMGFLDWDVRTGNTTWDKNWSWLFGLPRGVFHGNAGDWEKTIHCHDLPEVMEILNDHLTGETQHFDSEYRLVGSCGKSHSVHTLGLAVARNSLGRPTRVVLISQEAPAHDAKNIIPAESLNSSAYSPRPEEELEPFP
ncbi:MAG: PAS domain-containing protein [Gemmatimonadales bacterium]|nr:PAS domain-containing protein [Gemmatimonadales bacterium]